MPVSPSLRPAARGGTGKRRSRAPSFLTLPLVSALLVGVAACGSDSEDGSGNATPSPRAEKDPPEKKDPSHPDTGGLVILTRGNISWVQVYDAKTGKEKASGSIPQYAERNAWGRSAFAPDWSSVVYTSDEHELFLADYTYVGKGDGMWEKKLRIGGRPTYSGGKPLYAQPRFGPGGKRVYFLANDDKVYSVDLKKPQNLKEEATLPKESFDKDDTLVWTVTESGDVVQKAPSLPSRRGHEITGTDGTKALLRTDHGWYLKSKGSSAEPKLLFEDLKDDEGKPVELNSPGLNDFEILGWY